MCMASKDFLIAGAGKQPEVRHNGELRLKDNTLGNRLHEFTLQQLLRWDLGAAPEQED